MKESKEIVMHIAKLVYFFFYYIYMLKYMYIHTCILKMPPSPKTLQRTVANFNVLKNK